MATRGKLPVIVAAIGAALATNLATLGEQPTPVLVGRKNLKFAGAPPRIVFVPLGGQTLTTNYIGGNPAPLWRRGVAMAIHVWADDVGECEELANHLVATMDDLMHGSYVVTGEDWNTDTVVGRGELLVLLARIDTTWTREADAEVQPDGIPLTTEILELEATG